MTYHIIAQASPRGTITSHSLTKAGTNKTTEKPMPTTTEQDRGRGYPGRIILTSVNFLVQNYMQTFCATDCGSNPWQGPFSSPQAQIQAFCHVQYQSGQPL